MRSREILTEAWRNVVCGASRATMVGGALALVAGILMGAETSTVRASLDEAAEYLSSGAAIITMAAPRAIDAATCDAVAAADGVTAAGALREAADPLLPLALPGSSLPAYEVTPGFPALLGVDGTGGGIIVSERVALRLGLEVGDRLPLTDGQARIAGIHRWPDDGRRPGLGYAVLIPTTAPDPFDECWSMSWPESEASVPLLRSTIIADLSKATLPPVVSTVNQTMGAEFHGGDRFADRITRFAPAVGMSVAAGIAMLAVRRRRLELSAAEHLGVRRGDLLAVALVEVVIALVPAMCVVGSFGVVLAHGVATDTASILALSGRVPIAVAAGGLIGAACGVLSIRSRGMHAYLARR